MKGSLGLLRMVKHASSQASPPLSGGKGTSRNPVLAPWREGPFARKFILSAIFSPPLDFDGWAFLSMGMGREFP